MQVRVLGAGRSFSFRFCFNTEERERGRECVKERTLWTAVLNPDIICITIIFVGVSVVRVITSVLFRSWCETVMSSWTNSTTTHNFSNDRFNAIVMATKVSFYFIYFVLRFKVVCCFYFNLLYVLWHAPTFRSGVFSFTRFTRLSFTCEHCAEYAH